MAALKTSLTASSTRGMRPACILPPKVFYRRDRSLDAHPVRKTGFQIARHPVGGLLEVRDRAAGQGRGQRRALPRVLVVDLGHRQVELLTQIRLHGAQLRALGLETVRFREVQVDDQDGEVAVAHASSRSTERVS